MTKSCLPRFDLHQCLKSAGRAFAKNIFVSLLVVSILPLPGFVLWTDAPFLILCVELTLLDCFYLIVAVLLIYGMFATADGGDGRISIRRVLSPFLQPRLMMVRYRQFNAQLIGFAYSGGNSVERMQYHVITVKLNDHADNYE